MDINKNINNEGQNLHALYKKSQIWFSSRGFVINYSTRHSEALPNIITRITQNIIVYFTKVCIHKDIFQLDSY